MTEKEKMLAGELYDANYLEIMFLLHQIVAFIQQGIH